MRVEKVVSPPLDNNAYFLFDETSKLAAGMGLPPGMQLPGMGG